ncbi:MAG TPA: AI-2E family transporter [Kineosporiaceae bacterium]|nr:AI-2E family transporter [Kineosporiaceae bacterium]
MGIDNVDAEVVPRGLRAAAGWSWRLLAIGVAGYAVLRVLGEFRLLVVPLLISLLLVALVRPVTDALAGLRVGPVRIPRTLAAALTVLLTLTVLGGLITLIGQQVATGFPSLRVQAADGLQDIRHSLARGPLHVTGGQLDGVINAATDRLRANSGQVVSGALQVGATAIDVAAGTLLVLFSTFFLLAGGDRIWLWALGLVPARTRDRANGAGRLAWGTLTAFVRATVVVAAADGLGVALVAWLLGVPLPIPLGVLVFLGAFVPIVGSLVSGSVAVLIAFVANGPVLALAMLAGVLAVAQLEGHVLQPFLLGRAVRVHPLAVIVVITAGSLLAGVPGALFAVPVTAVANAVTGYLLRAHRGPDGAPEPAAAEPLPVEPLPVEPAVRPGGPCQDA